jgi:hypothetical protein
MALDSKNNIKSVFIVPSVTPSPAAGTKITPGSTTLGWVGITNMSNEVLSAGTVVNYSKIKIIKDRGANLPLQQVVLNLSDIVNTSAYSGAIATEQVSYIGYNGTSGSISEIDNNFYEIKLEHVPNAFAYGKRPANYKYGTYQSGVNATQEEISNGLVKSLVQNFVPNRTIDWRVFSEVTNAGARSAAGSAGTLTFTKYSKVVVASASTATDQLVVGDYIQSVDALTTVGVYKIVAIDGTSGNLTLDVAYNGDTISGVTSTDDIAIPEATAQAADFGIKITGIKQKYDVNRWRQYDKVRFNVFLINFGTTGSSTTAAFDGVAVYEQAANDEYISWGDEGQIFVDQIPPQFREQDAVVGTQYNPVVISWLNRLPSLIGAGENKGQVILYMAGGDGIGDFAPATNQATFVSVFNAWVPTTLDLPTTFPDPTV